MSFLRLNHIHLVLRFCRLPAHRHSTFFRTSVISVCGFAVSCAGCRHSSKYTETGRERVYTYCSRAFCLVPPRYLSVMCQFFGQSQKVLGGIFDSYGIPLRFIGISCVLKIKASLSNAAQL